MELDADITYLPLWGRIVDCDDKGDALTAVIAVSNDLTGIIVECDDK